MLIGNILDNALRYTPAGGRIDVAIDASQDQARLSVIDTGPGIAPADRQRVFERFYRGGAQDAAQGTGSGLGLSIVRRIANAHGAGVTLGEGPDGRGLAVDVRFPSVNATPTLMGLPATIERIPP
jgi:signal transduction histidine kinase